jgi:hypothetical protein
MARVGAKRRRRRRFTPRRWLPFVLLSALVVAAAVVEADDEPADDGVTGSATASAPLRTLPAVSAPDAIATAFYCAGGSALGDEGPAELTVVLANADDRGALADVTLIGEEGVEATTQIEVPANGRARLRAAELVEAVWVGALVEVRGGRVGVDREVVGPLGFDSAPCATEAADRWYVGSGSTVRGATMRLAFFNPFPDAASVDVTVATETGRRRPRALDGLAIPGRSIRVVDVGASVTDRERVAATVRVRSGRVTVDRLQSYDGSGDPLAVIEGAEATVPSGLVSVPATPLAAPRWVFPAVRTTAGARTQLALYNPSARDAEVDVVVTPEQPELNPEIEPYAVTVPAREQVLVEVADITGLVAGTDVWIEVRSLDGVAVVAERLSFFGEPSPRRGAAVAVGSPLSAERWMVVQAGATQRRSGTIAVANPGDTDAEITVRALWDGDSVELESARITVPAGDRRPLDLSDAGPAATIIVDATRPVVVSSSLASTVGVGIALQPALAFPEVVHRLG